MIKSYGLTILPDTPFNQTEGRKEAKRLTGKSTVPVMVTDDGEVVERLAEHRRLGEEEPGRRAGRGLGSPA